MPGPHSSFGAFHFTFLVLTVAPAAAGAAQTAHPARGAACTKAPVEIVAGSDSAKVALTRCDGTAVPATVEKLSVMDRPASVAKPKDDAAARHGKDAAPGVRRLDPRVVERLERVAEHFRKDGQTPRIVLVAGNKPRTSGSYHASGRAIDFKIEGTSNEDVVAFCKTMADTGCGYYPVAGFVHVDAREHGTGHVSWIDASKPGEAPKYVSSWPLAARAAERSAPVAAADEPKLPPLPAAASFAPIEEVKGAESVKVEEAPKTWAVGDAREAAKEPKGKDAGRKDAAKKEAHKGKRRHHRRPAQ